MQTLSILELADQSQGCCSLRDSGISILKSYVVTLSFPLLCQGAGRSPSQFPDLANVSEGGGHHNGLVVILLVVLVDALYRLDTRVLCTAEEHPCKQ